METTAEEQFWSHFDDRANSWRDGGPDLGALARLSPEERARVEGALLERLARNPAGDAWVAVALGELRSHPALSFLRRIIEQEHAGSLRVAAAVAIWKICADREAVDTIISILAPPAAPGRVRAEAAGVDLARIDAAVALGGIDTPESREALRGALSDGDHLVRANARSALRRLRTGVFDPFAELIEDGWTATRQQDGTITWSRPKGTPGQKD